MMRRSKIAGVFLTLLLLLVILCLSGFAVFHHYKNKVQEVFELAEECQAQNYYMALFDYKALAIATLVSKGDYIKAISLLDQLHDQLRAKENLIKMPDFGSKEEEMEFYLSLQNPKTGSFMDEAYPYGTWHGPTENVLLHIELLAKEIGQPVKLKYSLKYLDEIKTPEKLIAFLNESSIVGIIGSKFPQTSFHYIRDYFSMTRDRAHYPEDDLSPVTRLDLYRFSPEWKQSYLKWLYEARDPETGLWGPKLKNGKLAKKDLNNSASIIKGFVDSKGNDVYSSFPMGRYNNEMFCSILEGLEESEPGSDSLAESHEYNLKITKSIKVLTKYIWKDASEENKKRAGVLLEKYLKNRFENYHIPAEGAFSYYPKGEHAALDGVPGGFFFFERIGAFSTKKQTRLWGAPEKNISDLGVFDVDELTQEDFDLIANLENVNSLRLYQTTAHYDDLTSGVFAVVYPKERLVLDVMDLFYKTKHWIDTTPLTMGVWVSKAEMKKMLEDMDISFDEVEAYEKLIPLEKANEVLRNNKKLVVIGFDVLQIPRYKMVFSYSKSAD